MISDDPQAVGQGVGDRLRDTADKAKQTVHDIGEQAREMGKHARDVASEKLHDLGDRAGEYYESTRQKAMEMEGSLEQFIQEQPIKAVLIAAGIGLAAGFLLRSR